MPTKTAEPSATDRASVGASERVFKLLSENDWKSVVTEVEKAEKRKDDAATAITKELDDAKAKKGLHKGAFRDVRKLWKKTPAALEEYLVHLDHYRKLAGLDVKAGLQPSLEGTRDAPGTPAGEKDVRPQFLKDKTDGRGADTAKH